MAKYNEQIVEKITKLIEEDTYSVTDICHLLHISRKTFYAWNSSKPEFAKAIKTAIELRNDRLMIRARLSLHKKLDNYILTETKLKYIPDKDDPDKLVLKEKIVKTKEYAPDNGAIKIVFDQQTQSRTIQNKEEHIPIQVTVLNEETKQQLELLKGNHLTKMNKIAFPQERSHIKTG